MQNFELILTKLNAKKIGKGWMACCPAHNDKTPSLSLLRTVTGKILMHCFAGCSYREILSAIRHMGVLK